MAYIPLYSPDSGCHWSPLTSWSALVTIDPLTVPLHHAEGEV